MFMKNTYRRQALKNVNLKNTLSYFVTTSYKITTGEVAKDDPEVKRERGHIANGMYRD